MDVEWFILENTFLPALLIGVVCTLIGGVMWARRAPGSVLVALALAITVAIFATMKFVSFNVHGWTGILGPVAGEFLILAFVFVMFAFIRFLRSPTE